MSVAFDAPKNRTISTWTMNPTRTVTRFIALRKKIICCFLFEPHRHIRTHRIVRYVTYVSMWFVFLVHRLYHKREPHRHIRTHRIVRYATYVSMWFVFLVHRLYHKREPHRHIRTHRIVRYATYVSMWFVFLTHPADREIVHSRKFFVLP